MGNTLNSIMFQPPQPSSYGKNTPGTRLVPSGQDQISVFAHESGGPSDDRVMIFFSHGNAEDLGQLIPSLIEISTLLAVHVPNVVVAYDYPGYGQSTGMPSERTVFRAVMAVYEYAAKEFGIPPERTVVWGRSLGSGPTCYIAHRMNHQEKKPFAAVLLLSPLLSVFRVGLRSVNAWRIPFDQFCNYERAREGFGEATQVFVIHGERDEVVPFMHGKTINDIIPMELRHPPLYVPKAGHNDIEYRLSRMYPGSNSGLPTHVVQFVRKVFRC